MWGVELRQHTYGIDFYVKDELVQGFHITRNHRDDKTITYKNVHSVQYYQGAKAFLTKGKQMFNVTKESLTVYPPEPQHLTLELVQAHANGGHFSSMIEQSGEVYKQGSLWLQVAGESEFTLRNPHEQRVRLHFLFQPILRYGRCARVFIRRENGSQFEPQENNLYYIDLEPNEIISFCTQELDLDNKRIRWILDNVRLV